MSPPSNWNLLLIASDPWDIGLVREALSELEENQYARSFQKTISWQMAECLDDALDLAGTGEYDIALCDLQLSDSEGLHTFLKLRAKAPHLPVIVLVNRSAEDLGIAAMREGAQDYLLKEEFDCLPLARSIRYALERRQNEIASEEHWGIDKLTGLLDEKEFLRRASYAIELAASTGLSAALTVVEIAMEDASSDHTLDVLEIAERLRGLFEPPDLVARIGPIKYAALRIARAEEIPFPRWVTPSGIPVAHAHARFDAGAPKELSVLLSEAERALSENKLQTMEAFLSQD